MFWNEQPNKKDLFEAIGHMSDDLLKHLCMKFLDLGRRSPKDAPTPADLLKLCIDRSSETVVKAIAEYIEQNGRLFVTPQEKASLLNSTRYLYAFQKYVKALPTAPRQLAVSRPSAPVVKAISTIVGENKTEAPKKPSLPPPPATHRRLLTPPLEATAAPMPPPTPSLQLSQNSQPTVKIKPAKPSAPVKKLWK